ncbi:molybdopterin-dependent oxidoreductase [Caenispirillum salinarum]|uniref:molybdopterin-dependent oxidoreductase n=1 Tax=Caenispirillum salinarum TaxID=859058 RepID=UPI00384E1161
MLTRNFLAITFVAICFASFPAEAADMEKPAGPVVLTITGEISQTNSSGGAEFDIAMLEGLPGRTAEVDTPWSEGRERYTGPFLRGLLDVVGAKGGTLRVRALNDYVAEIPLEDVMKHEVILATRRDGSLMSPRERGPLFVIYPFDLEPDLYNELIFSRSVWQVSSIHVE